MNAIRNLIRTGLIASMVVCLAPAQAQEFSESHLAAARLVQAEAPLSRDFDGLLPLAAERVQNRLIQLRPDLHDVITEAVQSVALRLVVRRADLDNAATLLWARNFTEEELTQIAGFYQSEAGQKFLELAPSLGQGTIQIADNWTSRVGEELLEKTREELKKQGHEF